MKVGLAGTVIVATWLVVSASGCGSANTGKTVVRITPEDFFTGDRKRLEPHLEMSGARFKLEQGGPPMGLEVALETWTHGKPQRLSGSGGRSDQFPNEISVSAREMGGASGKEKRYRVVVADLYEYRHTDWSLGFIPVTRKSSGASSTASEVSVPVTEESSMRSIGGLENPIELTPNHPAAIWAITANKGWVTHHLGKTIEEMATRATGLWCSSSSCTRTNESRPGAMRCNCPCAIAARPRNAPNFRCKAGSPSARQAGGRRRAGFCRAAEASWSRGADNQL